MADITVEELAKIVGVTADKLISQMKSAGLSPEDASSNVSDKEKQALLAFLKKSHGSDDEEAAAPKKITLRKKATSKLKTTGSSGFSWLDG